MVSRKVWDAVKNGTHVRQRRSRKLSLLGRLFERDMGRCRYCGRECKLAKPKKGLPPAGAMATVDHITPVSRGGSSDMWNLALACWSCNNKKKDLTKAEFENAVRNGYVRLGVGKVKEKKEKPHGYENLPASRKKTLRAAEPVKGFTTTLGEAADALKVLARQKGCEDTGGEGAPVRASWELVLGDCGDVGSVSWSGPVEIGCCDDDASAEGVEGEEG